jgi:hypothetical protein
LRPNELRTHRWYRYDGGARILRRHLFTDL